MAARELDRVDCSQHLVEVAPGLHGIHGDKPDSFVGVYHEDATHGPVVHRASRRGVALGVGFQRPVELGHAQIGVGDDGISGPRALGLLDVIKPRIVVRDRIHRQADELHVPALELGAQLRDGAELGGAHRGEVLRVREQHRPRVTDPLMEPDPSVRRLCYKIRRCGAEPETHRAFPPAVVVMLLVSGPRRDSDTVWMEPFRCGPPRMRPRHTRAHLSVMQCLASPVFRTPPRGGQRRWVSSTRPAGRAPLAGAPADQIDRLPSGWCAVGMARRGVFVGREPELALLARALSEDVRLVLVVGDAGIGKTRFAAEGMSLAAAAGMLTVRGECLPLAATLPMLPVTSALRELARLDGGAVMESALTALPGFARQEVGRLLPQLATDDGGSSSAEWSDQWLRGRLFAGVADLLGEVAKQAQAGLGLLIEDVHWADSETLDFLTFLYKTGLQDAVSIVVTCRADEALPPEVAGWLAQVRSAAGTKEVRLGGLSRAQVAGQAAALAGGSVTSDVVDDLFIRAEGNPFFTEQLVTAALTSFAPDDQLRVPTELPHRLTDVLLARAAKSEGDARALLNSMAVMGRPAGEDLLAAVIGLGIEATMRALDELSRARLLADVDPGQGHRPRHALLAEAVSGGLLPAQRLLLHERTAQALTAMGADAVAAEAAEHWQAARRPASELQSRIAAARTAERIFGHAEAAIHWQRAISLWPDVPGPAAAYMRPNFFANTPDILNEYLQHGGPPAFRVRAVLAALLSPSWGIYSGYELCENTPLRPGSEEYLDSEKYAYRLRDWCQAEQGPAGIAPFITRLNMIRRGHPALHWLRNLRFHHVDQPEMICFSKRSAADADTVLAVVNLDPHQPREATVWLDMPALGVDYRSQLVVTDELSGESYRWGQVNYVRLDPATAPAHIFTVTPSPNP